MNNLPDPNKVVDNAVSAGNKIISAPLAFAFGLLLMFLILFFFRDSTGQNSSKKELEREVRAANVKAEKSDSLYRVEVDKNERLSHEFLVSQGVIREQQQTMIAAKSVIDSATSVRNTTAQDFHSAAAPIVKKILKNK